MCKKLTYFVLACAVVLCMATASQAADPHNVAAMGTVTVSSTGYGWTPDRAIDGDITTGSHSADNDPDKWLEIELDQVYALNAIEVVNRDSCCWERIATVVVKALDADRNEIYVSDPIAEADALQGSVHVFDNGGAGFADVRYIRLEGGTNFLQIMEVRAMITWPWAWAPIPADGEIEVDTTTLEWTAGDGAVSHDVYLSTDATIDDADLIGQTNLAIQVATPDPGVTHYWRVDEVDADGNKTIGEVWSFSTLPLEAHFPSPADGATNAVSAVLSWTPGKGAIMHNVHFGTDPAVLLPVQMMSMETSYDPGALALETTYYWRVDEFAGAATNVGPVWSLSTAPLVPSPGIADLEAWYSLDQDASSIGVLDMSGNNRHGSIYGDPLWGDGHDGGALDFGGAGDFVEMTGYAGVTGTNPRTLTAWINTAAIGEVASWGLNVAGQKWIFRVQESNGTVGAIRVEVNGGYQVGSIDVRDSQWHHVAAVLADDGTPNVTEIALYVDGVPEVISAQLDEPIDTAPTGNVRIGQSPWGSRPFTGLIDDVRIYSRAMETGEIRAVAGVAELPYSPDPADGAIDLESGGVVLTWNPAVGAVEQDVYLGTDGAAVAAADASDTTGIYRGRQVETAFAVADVTSRGVTYFWRVDGVTADGTVMPGPVWNFRIADRNTDNWADAVSLADPAYLDTYVQNGAYDVGTVSGDISYEFIVRSNPDETEPSMVLIGRIGHGDTTAALKYEQYNNTGNYGATIFGDVDLDYGVATAPGAYTHLVFVSSEAAGTTDLYVNGALEGSVGRAITLAGVVGIGQAIRDPEGAAFIDPFDGSIFGVAIYDRLLTADEIAANADKYFSPIPITDPDLLLYYDFESGEGNVAIDQSGHSNHGAITGATWVSGWEGSALDMAGVGYVEVPAQSWSTIENQMTIAFWAYGDPLLMPQNHTVFAAYSDSANNEARIASAHIPWGNGNVYFDTGGTPTSGGYDRISKAASPDEYAGQWRHWAFLKNAETGDQQIYLDGELWHSATELIRPLAGVTAFTIGARNDGGEIYPGKIDDFRLYNKALTGVEILKLGQPQLADVTAPGDTIQGVPNDGDWPGNEPPFDAIDDNVNEKYLHRKGGSMATGFQVEPAAGPTIVTGLTLSTANDSPGRDPVTFELSGSNDSLDGPYTLIASGDVVDFAQAAEWPRFTTNATAISFENAAAYKYYQVLFPTLRGDSLMQIAEVELLGVPAPLYVEDFESYAGGTYLQDVGGWAGWGGAGASAPVSNAFASSGSNSVEVIGSADLVQEFDLAGGKFVFSAMQYIPSGTTGVTFFILMNQYGAVNDWSTQTDFDLATGAIKTFHGATGVVTIQYDEWVELKCVVDLDENTVVEYYNGVQIDSGEWDDGASGLFGAVDLYGNGASSVYYDDIMVTRGQ